MFIKRFKFIGLILIVSVLVSGGVFAQTIQTPAEKTNFQSGPTMYDDLMKFVYDLDEKSELLQVQKVTETLRGRDVVLCILADPPVYKPSDIFNSGKPVVLIVNNVHGGEVAGKEASLILMRDLLFGDLKGLLKQVVVLNVPTINPDGSEIVTESQRGPRYGRRTNEEGFDMNRDYIKLETQEIQGLVTKVINKWQPDIHVDTHHGGSAPYTLTFQTNMNPAGDKELMRLGNEVIIPRIRAALRAEDYDGFWYSGPRTVNGQDGWGPTSVEPRKQHVYSTLANMVGFLFETPSGSHRVINNGTKVVEVPAEERYRHQVRGEYIGQLELIKYAADEPEVLRKTVSGAKKRATMIGANDSDNDQFPLEYEQVAKFKADFWRRKGSVQRGQRGAGGQQNRAPVEYELVNQPVFTKFEPTRTTTRPWGYILPPQLARVVPLFLDHGISIKKLSEPVSIEVEVYYATEVAHAQYFQGHYLKKFKTEKKTETVDFPAGSFFIPSGQPKSNLISYLLEPETNDNIGTWNFLDNFVRVRPQGEMQGRRGFGAQNPGGQGRPAGQRIPMYRIMKNRPLRGTLVESINTYNRNRYIK